MENKKRINENTIFEKLKIYEVWHLQTSVVDQKKKKKA